MEVNVVTLRVDHPEDAADAPVAAPAVAATAAAVLGAVATVQKVVALVATASSDVPPEQNGDSSGPAEALGAATGSAVATEAPSGLEGMAGLDGVAGLAVFSTVAHELRGPLMALATSAELLVADLDQLTPVQIREMVAAIHCRALWLQELVENLLCAGRLREGRLAVHVQTLNLIEVVTEVRQVVYPLLKRRDQSLRIRETAPGTLREVRADGRRLGQVLVNLILNASKFSPPGTNIEVILAAREGTMRVTVADRGPGFPAGLVEQLFEPFFRSPTSHVVPRAGVSGAAAPEGVGPGLAIVKEIILRHGGFVGAANRRGGGARFWFELPLRPSP